MEISTIAKRFKRPEKEFLLREDGRIEWVCEHGIGHTVWYPRYSDNVHGCDGCCGKMKRKEHTTLVTKLLVQTTEI